MMFAFFHLNYIQVPFQLLVSLCVFWMGMRPRKQLYLRLPLGICAFFLVSAVWGIFMGHFIDNSFLILVTLYVGYAMITIVPTLLIFESDFLEAFFTVAACYALQHISFAAARIVLYGIGYPYDTYTLPHLLLTRYVFFAIGAAAGYLILRPVLKKKEGYGNGDIRTAFLTLAVVAVAIGISIIWSYDNSLVDTPIGGIVCPLYAIASCVMILWVEFNVFNENEIRHEKETMEQLLAMADAQAKSSKEAIDIINIKCHDLKHQIRALEKMDDYEERKEYVSEIRQAISIYDAIYRTGNNSLDYVLREKTLLMNESHVEFTCLADGAAIAFMASSDIYSLVGNLLDNALEAVMKEDIAERIISLTLKQINDMVFFTVENRCTQSLKFQDGMPVTTKSDDRYHGFGMRSIRYITKKYDGEMKVKHEDGIFSVSLLLSIPEK